MSRFERPRIVRLGYATPSAVLHCVTIRAAAVVGVPHSRSQVAVTALGRVCGSVGVR